MKFYYLLSAILIACLLCAGSVCGDLWIYTLGR